jgi:hypothetical protein
MTEPQFDEDTREYLDSLKPGTRNIKEQGLHKFLAFYVEHCSKQGLEGDGIADFFDRIDADLALPKRQRKRVALNTMRAFVEWLKQEGYKNKTVRAYVCSVQTIGAFFDYPISVKYANLPASETAPENRQHPWNIEEVCTWVASLDSPLYRSLSTAFVQSGCDVSTLRTFTYGDIREELQAGIVPLCLEHTAGVLVRTVASRKKTGVPFRSFLGGWAVSELKAYLATRANLQDADKLFPVTKQAIDDYFRRHALKFANVPEFAGRNPFRPHSLRGAMFQFGKDHKADPDYMKYFMGKKVPEEIMDYINKDREGWREIYRVQVEPWVTPKQFLRKELLAIVEAWENMTKALKAPKRP